MDLIGILVIGAILIAGYFVSLWLELFIVGLLVKNLNKRFLIVALLNVVPAIASLAKGPGKFLPMILVGMPMLGLMYWQAKRAALKRPA